MAFTANDIIKKSFYLANILSNQSNESPSTAQETEGLDLLNEILDSLLKTVGFSGFKVFKTIPNIQTTEIWIGTNLVGVPPEGVTFINDIPFMALCGANCFITTNTAGQPLYPLIIYPLTALTRRYYIRAEAIPKYIYYATIEDDNLGIYNKLLFDPAPNSNGITLNLIGVKQYDTIAEGTTNLRPTFSLYLQYALAFELAMSYGTEDKWNNTQKSKRKDELYYRIVSKNPLNFTISADVDGYSKRSSWFISSTGGT